MPLSLRVLSPAFARRRSACMSHATAQKSNSQYREEATMSKKATTSAKANIYRIVTERIIASLRTA
jgi:hypothetical protein